MQKEISFFIPVTSRWIIALSSLLTLILLCWLPYHVPVSPSFSDSYLFGYNNRAALLLVGLFALFVAWLAARSSRVQEAVTLDETMSRKTLSKALWLTAGLGLPLHLIVRHTGGYVESSYFLDRIKLVLDGKVPYRDFEYAYGASFLYLPAWLARSLHLSVADAYGVIWLIVNLLGMWMLFQTVQSVQSAASAKRGIFIFFFAMSLLDLLCMGVNYSTFRFVLPLFLALLLFRRLHSPAGHNSQNFCIFLVVPCFLLLLLVSPEMAISFALGTSVYLAYFADLRIRSNLASFLVMLLLLGVVAHIASICGVFLTLNAFRTGGFNFPVMPAASIILLMAAAALTGAYAGIRVCARQGSPELIFIAASAVGLAGAMGRCDPAHILLNPLGIWISAFAIVDPSRGSRRVALLICTLVFLLIPLTWNVRGALATPARAALLTVFAADTTHPHTKLDHLLLITAIKLYGPQKANLKLDEARRFAQLHDGMDIAPIFGYPPATIYKAPFQFTPEQFGPIHTAQVDTGYFYAMGNLLTPQQVLRKVEELAANPDRPLLLPEGAENSCGVSPEGERLAIRNLFLYPYNAPVKHPDSVLQPICTYIRDHYVLVQVGTPDRLGYAVWERRPAQSTLPDARRDVRRGRP